jgi:hypothetical protein
MPLQDKAKEAAGVGGGAFGGKFASKAENEKLSKLSESAGEERWKDMKRRLSTTASASP